MKNITLEKDSLAIKMSVRYGLDGSFHDCITDYDIGVYQLEYSEDSNEPKEECVAQANILYIEGYEDLRFVLDVSPDTEPFMELLNDDSLVKDYWDEYYREDEFFIINRFKLEKKFRDKKLGVDVLRLILKAMGPLKNDYMPIFLIPSPIIDGDSNLSKKEEEKARKKLVSVYKDYGFKTVEKRKGYKIMGLLPCFRSKLAGDN